MRKKKFKVFDYTHNKMYPNDYELIKEIYFDMYGEVDRVVIARHSPTGDWECEALTEFELLQFTGLQDEVNKRIYEGDILKYKGGIGEVIYQGSGYFIKNFDTDLAVLGLRQCVEVQGGKFIGNKFENPKLLKE